MDPDALSGECATVKKSGGSTSSPMPNNSNNLRQRLWHEARKRARSVSYGSMVRGMGWVALLSVKAPKLKAL